MTDVVWLVNELYFIKKMRFVFASIVDHCIICGNSNTQVILVHWCIDILNVEKEKFDLLFLPASTLQFDLRKQTIFNPDFSLKYILKYETVCVRNLSQVLVREQAYLIKVLFNRLYKF